MSVVEEIKTIVEGVARSGALTPEAIRQFDEMGKRVKQLEASLDAKRDELESTRKDRDRYSRELSAKNDEVTALSRRAEAAELKNAEADKAIWIAKFEAERRQEMRSIVSDVFRNAEVQRMISNSVPHWTPPAYQGGSPTLQYSTETRTETETRK